MAGVIQEEEERELEMKQIESARYEHEIKMAQREAEEEKIRRKQAYNRSGISHIGNASVYISTVAMTIAQSVQARRHERCPQRLLAGSHNVWTRLHTNTQT